MKKYLSLLFAVLVTLSIQSSENGQKDSVLSHIASAKREGWVDFSDVKNIHETAFIKAICAFNRRIVYPRNLMLRFRGFDKDLLKSEDEDERKLGILAVASQLECGISKNDRLPVRLEIDKNTKNNNNLLGDCNDLRINIYELTSRCKLGIQRHVLLHEAAHVYHKHHFKKNVIGTIATCFGALSGIKIAFFILNYLLKRNYKLNFLFKLLSICGLGLSTSRIIWQYVISQYSRYCEQQADLIALSKLQCFKCLEEYNENIEVVDKNGYVSNNRIKLFVNRYKQAGVLCPFHTRRADLTIRIQDVPEQELREYLEQLEKNQRN